MANAKSIVIWIENKAELDLHDDLKKWLSNKGVELNRVENVAKLADKLENMEVSTIRGFIVDMMLDGPNNLSSFGIKNIVWNHDINDAGKVLLDYVLKEEKSRYINIPTLILSVRPDTPSMVYPNTTLVIKRDITNRDWHKNLRKWVDDL